MLRFHKFIYHKLTRGLRLRAEAKIVNSLSGKTILDVGYFDGSLKRLLRSDFDYFGIDPSPAVSIEGAPKVGIEDFSSDKKFDIVIASNILEHVSDPVLAMRKLKELSAKYICVGVPYEPYFTMFRFFVPEPEHLWTIHPNALAVHFGKSITEKFIQFGRFYYAVFKID